MARLAFSECCRAALLWGSNLGVEANRPELLGNGESTPRFAACLEGRRQAAYPPFGACQVESKQKGSCLCGNHRKLFTIVGLRVEDEGMEVTPCPDSIALRVLQ